MPQVEQNTQPLKDVSLMIDDNAILYSNTDPKASRKRVIEMCI